MNGVLMSNAWTLPAQAVGGWTPGGYPGDVVDAELVDPPTQRQPRQPHHNGNGHPGNHGRQNGNHGRGPKRRFGLPQDRSEQITWALWAAGPVLAVYGWFVAHRPGLIVLGVIAAVMQWENRKYLARVPARPKVALVALGALLAVGFARPELPDQFGVAVEQFVQGVTSGDTPAEPAPAPVQADPAQQPQQ